MRHPEPLLRCSPADFGVGSDRGDRDGWFNNSTFHFINIKSFVGRGACGYVGEGELFAVPLAAVRQLTLAEQRGDAEAAAYFRDLFR